MERLTHEADFGLEDWEQILYRVPADPEGAYNIFDIAERWVHYDDADCGCILQDITKKLRDYENIAPKVDELYLEKCQEVSELTKRMRWIPVKERLPEKSGVYWITMRHTDGSLSTERYYWKSEYWNKQAWKEVVVAWQPYDCPEPYRQEA